MKGFLALILVVQTQCGVVYDNDKVTFLPDNVLRTRRQAQIPTIPVDGQGIIGGVIQSTREIISSVQNFITTEQTANGGIIIGNLMDTVRNGLAGIRDIIIPPSRGEKPTFTANQNTELIKENIDKVFVSNGTRCVQGKACRDAIEKIRKRLEDLHNKKMMGTSPVSTTRSPVSTTRSPINFGEDLIDIRIANATRVSKSIQDGDVGVSNDVYDNVND